MEARLQELTFSVAEILGRPCAYRDLRFRGVVDGVAGALARLDETSVEGNLRAESVVEGVLVTGPVRGRVTLTCARCLESFSAPLSVEACELYVERGKEGEDGDAYALAGDEIDLEPMLRDVLGLGLPLHPRCRPDCLGLCGRCGRDLNHGPCTCDDVDVDPRWAALEDLRDKLGDAAGAGTRETA